jgi:uncharacterized glyoxalase superfamily protein PhnB
MADPLEVLRQPVRPLAPDPAFASDLRRRVAAALGPASPSTTGATMSDTRAGTPAAVAAITITPYLSCTNARAAIEWYQEAFGAVLDGEPIVMPDGTIGHSELLIGGARIMVAEEYEPENVRSPEHLGGTSVQLVLNVPDVDAVFERAVAAGARVWRPVNDGPHGARLGKLRDPYGHNWFVETPLEPAPPEPATATAPAAAAPEPEPASAPAEPASDPTIVYFTVETPDDDRARAFLGTVLGWRFAPGHVPRGWEIVNAVPGGGLWGGREQAALVAVFTVDDVDAAVARVRDLGGDAADPQDMPYGRLATCTDDQGLRFDLLQLLQPS